jgi:hypothetical protein
MFLNSTANDFSAKLKFEATLAVVFKCIQLACILIIAPAIFVWLRGRELKRRN